MLRLFLFIPLIAVLFLSGCKTAPKNSADKKPTMFGTWKLESIACESAPMTAAGAKRAADLNHTWEQYQSMWPDSIGQALKIKLSQTPPDSHCRVTVASKIVFKGGAEYEVTKTGAVYVMLGGPQDRRCRGAARNTDVYTVKFEWEGDSLTLKKKYEWFANMKRKLWEMNATCEGGAIVEKYRRIPQEEYPLVK